MKIHPNKITVNSCARIRPQYKHFLVNPNLNLIRDLVTY
jgi:hypothetical protein